MAVPAFAQGALLWEDTFVTDGSLRDRTSEGWWTGLPIWTGQAALQVVSGLVATGQADGTYADAFANGPGSGVTDINDLDVVLEDISVKPGTNRQIYLHARLIPQGVGTGGEANGSGATSYAANFTTLSGADRWRLSKQVNGAFTALGTGGQVNQEESAGFGMGLRVLGGTQELYRQASVGGGWTQLLTASDTAISPTSDDARWIGLECNGSAFRAGRIAVYSVADDSDVETSGTVTSVAEVRAASSQVFFSGSLAAAAVVSGVTTLPGILQTQGDVTSVAVVTGVSDTSAPVGDATSRAIVTGVSALVGEEEVGSNGLTVSTAVVSTAGVIVSTGRVVSMSVLSSVNGTPGTIATQGLVVSTAEIIAVSAPTGKVETLGTVVSVSEVTARTSLNPLRTTGVVVSTSVVTGVSAADTGLIASLQAALALLANAVVAREVAVASARLSATRSDDDRAAHALQAAHRAYRETERALSLAGRLP